MSARADRSALALPVRQAFLEQARHCAQLGSPFMSLLCRTLGEGLEDSSDIERHILHWRADAGAHADALALRLAGALHYLVRVGRAGALAELYPPHRLPDAAVLLGAARRVLTQHRACIGEFLRAAPQTNEVGRSAALIAGWLEVAARTQRPLSLFELGSSAGLNLIADRYRYQFGDVSWTPRGASSPAPRLACGWKGRRAALEAPLSVVARRGCDRNPLNMTEPAQRERLMAYVWADQHERLERLAGAIEAMLTDPLTIETADAAQWLEAVLPVSAEPGIARVVFHSVLWGYLAPMTRERIAAHLARVGGAASPDRPLAWLRLELGGPDEPAELRLTMWPGGEAQRLARVHAHGAWVRWEGE